MGAYRLLGNEHVTPQAIQQPSIQQVRNACGQPGHYLLIEDTTQVDFTGKEVGEALGMIGDGGGRGLHVHSTLALRMLPPQTPDQRPPVQILGLFDQHTWQRHQQLGSTNERKAQRLSRPRESQRWAAVLEDPQLTPPPGAKWTVVTDSEGDIYEVFERCRARGVDFIIRASQARSLEDADGSILDAVAADWPVTWHEVDLRARPGQAARTAELEIRAVPCTLRGPWRPDRKPPPQPVWVVEAKEINAPPEVDKPLRWVLLTSWPCPDAASALAVVAAYTLRQIVEEYHKCLKSGTNIEESQLNSARGIEALLAILAVAAVRLLSLKFQAAEDPDGKVAPDEVGPEALEVLSAKWGRPPNGWRRAPLLIAIARLGGFLARKSDGMPGWQTLWRGWQRLMLMIDGYLLAKRRRSV